MAFKSFPKLSILAVVFTLLLSHHLYEVSAATGGRMGGSSFSSESPPSHRNDDDYHHYNHHDLHHRHHHHYHHSQPGFPRSADQESGPTSAAVSYLILTIFMGVASVIVYSSTVQNRTSILQVQVGLSAKARSLQKELTEIASTTDTSTAKGWNIILEETVSSLLHHPHCYLHGYSSVTHHWTVGSAEQQFQRLSKEERLKFDVETLVNVNNIKRQRAVVPNGDKGDKDRIVVTVLVAAQGAHKLPTINTTDNVKEALQYLADISSSKIKGVEVLWSPQDETDSLSVEELLENYPQMRRI
ncbi:hypothetical protein ERO13_D02G038700v2 [Gossypium hirsutum]|uniref:Uncharacterized protein n=1 Tax=Gossypium hirsutum TaxID=3635 RepID=A0A1U8LID8_GOSHI|nr:uncharacterized protein LOC107927768 [Gossypium hirsutum]KAG4157064.1 hypothetical protein ERO13_D02G038700v2 [Gossypium hirsutum]